MGKLTGWQRVWVFVAALFGVALIVYGSLALPTSETADAARSFWHASRSLLHDKQMEGQSPCSVLRGQKPESTFFECLKKEAQEMRQLESAVAKEDKAFDDVVSREQLQFVMTLGGMWVAFAVGTYALGLAIGWVKNGFGNANNSD